MNVYSGIIIAPISLYLAQISYRSLVSVLVLANPFTIAVLLLGLDQLTRVSKDDGKNNTRRNKNLDINLQDGYICCSYKESRIFLYFKHWLLSAHLILLLTFQFNTVPSLQITPKEVVIFFISYIALCILILNLKYHILSNLNLQSTLPLNEDYDIIHSSNQERQDQHCNGICYLMLLAQPILPKEPAKVNNKSDVTNSLDICSSNISGEHLEAKTVDVTYDLATFRRLLQYSSSSVKCPTSASYLLLCNFIHIFILVQYFYLNITFCCASNITRFGTILLIPGDCTDIYYSKGARIAMFGAVYSAQILFCQLALMCRPLIS